MDSLLQNCHWFCVTSLSEMASTPDAFDLKYIFTFHNFQFDQIYHVFWGLGPTSSISDQTVNAANGSEESNILPENSSRPTEDKIH